MLGAIAGDIIGSAFESDPVKRLDFPLFGPMTRFTDDTVLTVAVAHAILQEEDYAASLKRYGQNYPDRGYGSSFYCWMFASVSEPYDSWGNGSAMRVSPVGFAFDSVEAVLREAEKSAAVTHNHPEGIKGAQAVALAIYLARTGRSKDEIRHEITRRFGYDLERTLAEIRPRYCFDISCQGSVPESIIAFLESDGVEDAIRKAVSLGGDSDTMGCIAGGIAEAYWGGVPAPLAQETRSRLPQEFIAIVDRFYERYPLAARGPGRADSTNPEPRADPTHTVPLRPIADMHEYRLVTERLARQLAADPGAAALARELERSLRYEIGHAVPQEARLASRLSARTGRRARRTALISDIHGNHAGLLAVLADIEKQQCDRILCLGDLVDGGPDNEQVIETIRRLGVPCVRGNHDETNDLDLVHDLRRFLAGLPEYIIEDDVLYTHISPRPKKRKINHAVEAWNVFDESDFRLLFIGHVHVPMIFGMRSDTYGEAAPHAFEYNKPLALSRDERYIVSTGAIGYGRDDVGRIRYAIYDREAHTVELRAIDGPLLRYDYTLGGISVEFS